MHSLHGNELVFSEYAQKLIHFKSRQISRRQDFNLSDQPDLEQEFRLALLKKVQQFDPARASLETFAAHVVDTAVAMSLRDRRRLKRAKGFHTQSLDVIAERNGLEAESLSAAVSDEDLARRTGVERADDMAHREDAEAIGHALAQMPQELRDLCRRVMGGTISSVARDLGVSRRQVRKGLAAARVFLEQAGFDLD